MGERFAGRREMSRRRALSARVGRPPTDPQLVRRVLDGETELFEMLFHRHSQKLYRAARAILRNDDEAGDVVQESFLRAYAHLNQFAGRAKFSTWLTKIAVYEARARNRRRGRGEEPPDERGLRGGAAAPDQETRVLVRETRSMLEAAIDSLPTLYRAVFVLREVEEMSSADTAEVLNLSIDAVKTRLRRSRILLRKKLYKWGGALGREAFRFAGRKCERMWKEGISRSIRATSPGRRRSPGRHR
jgi:RNA polymerase sigma-70 factor (ECF subfamily)